MDKTFKHYTAEVEQLSDRKMSFTITTAAVDRDNDTIDPKGWDLSSYMKNPVVLWAHDYSQPPVGKAVNIRSTANGLQADVEFLPKGVSPFADQIHEMCKGGFLNATSVGFRGTEYDEAKDRKGYDFKKQELLEFSIVPVPSNPEALAQRGMKNDQLKRYAKDMREWSKSILGEQPRKMTVEQFDSLSVELAKILKETPEEKKEVIIQPPQIDTEEIALAVVKILEAKNHVINREVIDIQEPSGEIAWDAIEIKECKEEHDGVSETYLAEVFRDGIRTAFREVAGAQARAAVNKLTGRLD